MIIRPFIPNDIQHVTTIIGRALALTEEEVIDELNAVRLEFASRHFEIEPLIFSHYEKVKKHVSTQRPLSKERELLIGALFPGNTPSNRRRFSILRSCRILTRAGVERVGCVSS